MGNKTCLVELDVLISYSIEVSDSIVFGARVDTRYICQLSHSLDTEAEIGSSP